MAKNKPENVDDLFAEYETERARKRQERDEKGKVSRAFEERCAAGLRTVVIPALEALAGELRSKGCAVDITQGGADLVPGDPSVYPRVGAVIHPPGGKSAIVPMKVTFTCSPGREQRLAARVYIEKHLGSGPTTHSEESFNPDGDTAEVRELVLRHFREVLFDKGRHAT